MSSPAYSQGKVEGYDATQQVKRTLSSSFPSLSSMMMLLIPALTLGLGSLAAYSLWPFSFSRKTTDMIPSMSSSPDLLRSLFNSFGPMSTHTPRIVRTPNTYNALFDLPGFDISDLKITSDDNFVYVKGHTKCPESTKTEKKWSGEEYAQSERDMCIERNVDAQVSLPKGTHEHGRIQALLDNGVLRLVVPLYAQRESLGQRIVDIFYGRPKEAYEDVKDRMYRTGQEAYERGQDIYGSAQDAAQKVKKGAEKASDYAYDTARDAKERVKGAGQYAREQAEGAGRYASDKASDTAEEAKRRMGVKDEPSPGIYEKVKEKIMHPFKADEGIPIKKEKLVGEL